MPLEEAGDVGPRPHAFRRLLARFTRQEAVLDRAYRRHPSADGNPLDLAPDLLISIIMPVHEPPPTIVEAAIASVVRQTHRVWELCIADDGSSSAIQALLQTMASSDRRIRIARLERNLGVAAATNAALAMASGTFCAFMDHDDELSSDALAWFASEAAEHPDADVIFSDEDQIDEHGRRVKPYFKPGWNPDLMLSQNAAGHLAAYRRTLVKELGGVRADFAGSQDYDLALRAAAKTPGERIRHIPRVLYHWRQSPDTFSRTRAALCEENARRAVAEHLEGRARVIPNRKLPQWNTAEFARSSDLTISVIAATKPPPGFFRPAENIELIIGSPADVAARAHGDILVFIDRLLDADAGWLDMLRVHAARPEIGCVGARVDDRHGRVIQAGYVLDWNGIAIPQRGCADPDDPGYRGQFVLARTVSAVSAQCFAVRRDWFDQSGGFDPAAGAYADVDFCLRVASLGGRCLWTPEVRVRTSQGVSRKADASGAALMRERWGALLRRDPFLNPNLTIARGRLALARNHRSSSP